MNEPRITINGIPLSEAQASTVWVAIGTLTLELIERKKASLADTRIGADGLFGRTEELYLQRLAEIEKLMMKEDHL